jgi:DNA-binding PadR family transcriptional regulator
MLHHEPLSGYDLRKRIKATIGLFWDLGFGQIYPALEKLEHGGLVTGRTEKGDGRPDKRVYTITESGSALLREWLADPTTKEYVRYEVLLKVFFGDLVDAKCSIAAIEEFRRRNLGLVRVLEQYEQELMRLLPESRDHRYYLLTVQFGLRVYRAYLEWAEEAIRMLETKAPGLDESKPRQPTTGVSG